MGIIDSLPEAPRRLLQRLCRDGRDQSTGELLRLNVDNLPEGLGWTAIALRQAADFLIEAGLAEWIDRRSQRFGPFEYRCLAATVEGEAIARDGVSPAEIRRQLSNPGPAVTLTGSTFVNASVQIGEGNVAGISAPRLEARPDVRVRVQLGVMGPAGGPTVRVVSVTAVNAGSTPVVVSGLRWCMRNGDSVVFERDSLGVLNGDHTIPPGDDYGLVFEWPRFRAFLGNDLVAVAVRTKAHGIFRSDSEEFRRVVDHVQRYSSETD